MLHQKQLKKHMSFTIQQPKTRKALNQDFL